MISRKLFIHLTRLLCLFSLSCTIYCSGRFNIHVSMLNEAAKSIPSLQDPLKISIYEQRIVPWLSEIGHLSAEEISSINLASLNRLVNPQLPPLFSDSKKLFELVELLIENDLHEISSAVLKYMRLYIFSSSTFKIVLDSLSRENLAVFNKVMELWFPRNIDIISLIHNLVDLRMGEDAIMEILELTWPKLVAKSPEESLKNSFAKILGSAMLKQYVSVFEDILERLPELIKFIHCGMNNRSTIVHFFCHATDSKSLNKLKIVGQDGSGSPQSPYFDHLIRGYSSANNDLLAIMIKFGADINALDCDGLTPLHRALHLENAHIVQVLVDAGADVNIRDPDGMTPLSRAVNSKNFKIAEILIKSGRADLNSLDGERMTPLHRAIIFKNASLVQMLLDAGADYTIKSNGRNILQLIYSYYSHEVEAVVNDFLTSFRFNRSRSISSVST